MDQADSAATAIEGNLPKPLKLLGVFHYVYPLLAMVETNVVVVVFFFFLLLLVFLKFDCFLIMTKKKVITFFLEEILKWVLLSPLMGSFV